MMSSDNVEWTKWAGYESRWGGKSNMNLIHDEEEEGHVSIGMKEITCGAEWKKAGFSPFPSCTKNPGIWFLFFCFNHGSLELKEFCTEVSPLGKSRSGSHMCRYVFSDDTGLSSPWCRSCWRWGSVEIIPTQVFSCIPGTGERSFYQEIFSGHILTAQAMTRSCQLALWNSVYFLGSLISMGLSMDLFYWHHRLQSHFQLNWF